MRAAEWCGGRVPVEDFDELRTKLEAVFNILLSPAVGDYACHTLRSVFASTLRNRPGNQS